MIRAWRPAALPSRQALLTLALFAVLMATVLALVLVYVRVLGRRNLQVGR